MIRDFRVLDWLPSVSGAKIIAQKTLFDKNIEVPRKVWFALSGQIFVSHNSEEDWARELFKPSKDAGRLVVQNQFCLKIRVWSFWLKTSWLGKDLRFFDDVNGDPMNRFRGSKFNWILGYNTSLQSPWTTL